MKRIVDRHGSVLFLRIVVVLLIAANCYGIVLGITRKPEILAHYPGLAEPWPVYFVSPFITIISLVGILRWKMWGVWLAFMMGFLVFGIELYACGPAPHIFRVPAAITLMAIGVFRNWSSFTKR